MLNLHPRLVFAATAATALSFALTAQDAIKVSETGALVRTDGVTSSFSRDGGTTWTALPANKHQLNWRDRSFDPRVGDPGVPPALMADSTNRLFYVQYVTDIIPEYADAMRQLGADHTRYYPNQAQIVRIGRDRLAQVRQLPFVRALMDLETGHKLDMEIQVDLLNGLLRTARYNIVLVDKHKDAPALEARIQEIGGLLNMRAEGGILVDATLTPAQLKAVARENTVLWIDRWTEPGLDIDNARIQAGVNYVESVAGIDGKGISGHINEGVNNHVEFGARAPYRSGPINLMAGGGSSHGTNTAGEIYSQGLNASAKGILPFAQLLWSNRPSNRYQLVQNLVDPNQQYKAVMMTQSWGGGRTTSYTSTSALLDDILFDFPKMLATNSQSNAGARPSRPEAWSKNVIGVGGFLHRGNTNPADDCWCNTGSIGPAQDGRVGVTFTGYYDGILTTSGTTGYTGGFGGTSGATPIVNGLSGATIQMYTDGHFGYHPGGVGWQNRHANTPNLTTTRVLMSMGTRQLSFTGTNRALRVEQGWGFPNLQDLYDNRDNILISDEEDVVTTGRTRQYLVWVKPGTPEFRASMHHLEDAAVPSAIPTRINSLSLFAQDPNGNTYWGNSNSILNGPWSTPGGSPNDVDIHENVYVPNPTPGIWRVAINAENIRQDNHRETAAVDADFALAIRGASGRDRTGMTVDLTSAGPGQMTVTVNNMPGTWNRGMTVMSPLTKRGVGNGGTFGVEKPDAADNYYFQPGVEGQLTAFVPSANPATYPNAAWNGPSASGTFDAVVILFNGNNVVAVSNVSRVTVQ